MIKNLAYSIIETAIDRGINDIKVNKSKSIQNLLSIGATLAPANIQKTILSISKEMLADSNSPYYALINHIVNNVDEEILKRLLMNIGYHAWTLGTKTLREKQKIFECDIPWTLTFDFTSSCEFPLSIKEVANIINHGLNLGIYSGMFFVDNNVFPLKQLIPILASYEESAFFLFLRPEQTNSEVCELIKKASNIIVSLKFDEEEDIKTCYQAITVLKEKKLLFGAFSFYNDENIETTVNYHYLRQITQLQFYFTFIIHKKHLYNSIQNLKFENKFPFFIIDYYSDLALLDLAISGNDCFIAIKTNGEIAKYTLDHIIPGVNIHSQSLENVLRVVKRAVID